MCHEDRQQLIPVVGGLSLAGTVGDGAGRRRLGGGGRNCAVFPRRPLAAAARLRLLRRRRSDVKHGMIVMHEILMRRLASKMCAVQQLAL